MIMIAVGVIAAFLLLICFPLLCEIIVVSLIGLSRASGKTLVNIGVIVLFVLIVVLAATLR